MNEQVELLANVYIEGYKDGQLDAAGGFVFTDSENPYADMRKHLTELTHQQIVALIEDAQYLRDLATIELARRDPRSKEETA